MSENIEEKKAKDRDEVCAANARMRIKLAEARNIIHDTVNSDDKAFFACDYGASYRQLSAGIAKLRELLRPEPDSEEWRTEAVYYGATLPGEYRTPPAAIDVVMANPPLPLGGCKQPTRMPGPTKVQVITTPGAAALRYLHSTEDLSRITADIQKVRKFDADGKETLISHITCYNGEENIVQCNVFRGRGYAIKVARAIIKALMGRLGKRRRAAANRAARKAAEPQGQRQEDLHTPPARRGEEKSRAQFE